MQVALYTLCIILLCAPAAFGTLLPGVDTILKRYRDGCITTAAITDADVISQIKSRKIPEDGSADRFAICLLKTTSVLKQDGTVNKDVRSYQWFFDTGSRFDIAELCVPKGESAVSGKEAVTILKCLESNHVYTLPFTE